MDYKEMLSLIRDLKIEKLLEVNTNEKDIQNFLKALNEDIEIHNDVLEKEKKGLKKDSKEYKNIRKKQKILEKNKKDNQIIINNESVSKIAINYVNNEYVEREVAMS
jgi:hypothetical protein